MDEELGETGFGYAELGVVIAEAREVIEEQVRDRAVRGPGIARIAARTRCVERICGPIESLVAREPQRPFGRQAAVAFLDEQVSAVAQHADRFAEEAVGIRQVMDDVVRDDRIERAFAKRERLRVEHAADPRPDLGIGKEEPLRREEAFAESGAAADLRGDAVRSEVPLHPREALVEREAQVGAAAPVELIAGIRDVVTVCEERH